MVVLRISGPMRRIGLLRFCYQRMLMFPNPFPSGMKMTPEVAPLGSFPLVAGTGFEPATSGL